MIGMNNSKMKKRSLINRIKSHLWIIISIIPYLNGIGFVYIGSKTSINKWIIEGCIYEIPWIILIILYPIQPLISVIFIILGIISIILSLIRSIKVNSKYQSILDSGIYRKSKDRFETFIGAILSAIPIVNGVTFIYLGKTQSKKSLILEGIIYEIPFVLGFLNPLFWSIGLCLAIVSLIRFIIITYKNLKNSYRVKNSSTNTKKEEKKDKSPKETKTTKEKTTQKKKINKDEIFRVYVTRINTLTEEFDKKEIKVSKIIENRFKASKITYNHFMNIIASAHENFYTQKDSALKMIELTPEYNLKIEEEIKKKIMILKQINEKITTLTLELVINNEENQKTDDEINELFDDMEELIETVNKYN